MLKKYAISVFAFIFIFVFCLTGCKGRDKEILSLGEVEGNRNNSSVLSPGDTVTAPNGQEGTVTEDGKGIVATGNGSIPAGRYEQTLNSSNNSSNSSSNNNTTSSTQPSKPSSTVDVPSKDITYNEFIDLSPEVQQAFVNSFDSITDFSEWYNAALKTWQDEKENDKNHVVGDGSLDLRDYID